MFAIVCSVCEFSASPIEPSRPASRPAPKSMSTAIPFAVAERKTEPSSDERRDDDDRRGQARAPAPTGSVGHQSPIAPVITTPPA